LKAELRVAIYEKDKQNKKFNKKYDHAVNVLYSMGIKLSK
jgi:hypothetical protein